MSVECPDDPDPGFASLLLFSKPMLGFTLWQRCSLSLSQHTNSFPLNLSTNCNSLPTPKLSDCVLTLQVFQHCQQNSKYILRIFLQHGKECKKGAGLVSAHLHSLPFLVCEDSILIKMLCLPVPSIFLMCMQSQQLVFCREYDIKLEGNTAVCGTLLVSRSSRALSGPIWYLPAMTGNQINDEVSSQELETLNFNDTVEKEKWVVQKALLQFKTLYAFTSQGFASSKLLPSIYWSNALLNRSAKILDIQASPRASTFMKNIFASRCSMHATTFAPHLLNHLRKIAQHSPSNIIV